jgi:hypothetical protein
MIYFTTFIFTLLIAHIARAVPACGNVASPEDMYDPTYDDEQLLFATDPATWDSKYDNPSGDSHSLECSNFPPKYPHFKDLPDFPLIGASSDIQGHKSPNCGKCWKLTYPKTRKSIYFFAVDSAKSGFILSKHAYSALGGENSTIEVEAVQSFSRFCTFKSQ